ncbi:MAG: 2-dehydro-3-deoxy-6-phosphogalactonate aldolase [Betaproteobacteria bacterium]|jgi:2-dehydro-3-deoxyphosphogalactonate aldolase
MTLQDWLDTCPLVAILRGITPDEVQEIGAVLLDAGFRIVEVPLNSPDPLESITRLSRLFGESLLVGAGTVLDTGQVAQVAAAGGRLVVSPHSAPEVIAATRAAGLFSIPGFATPTEGFGALAAGADALKLFPAEACPPTVLKALRAVLPTRVPVLPVGSISPDSMGPYLAAGANGFGLGSALYRSGMDARQVGQNARAFLSAWRALQPAPGH